MHRIQINNNNNNIINNKRTHKSRQKAPQDEISLNVRHSVLCFII
jgi:hypothetical protein